MAIMRADKGWLLNKLMLRIGQPHRQRPRAHVWHVLAYQLQLLSVHTCGRAVSLQRAVHVQYERCAAAMISVPPAGLL